MPASGQRSFALAGQCGIPATAKAVSINVTITAPAGAGFLVLFQGGIAAPSTTTINFAAGQTLANNAVVGVAQDGNATLNVRSFVTSGTVQVIMDVNGYFQ